MGRREQRKGGTWEGGGGRVVGGNHGGRGGRRDRDRKGAGWPTTHFTNATVLTPRYLLRGNAPSPSHPEAKEVQPEQRKPLILYVSLLRNVEIVYYTVHI